MKRMKDVSVNKYQQLIAVYLSRKKKMNENINRKLRIWRCGINRIKKRNAKIKELILKTNDYFNVDIKANKFDRQTSFARYCYYKYGLEHQISNGKYLSEAIGRGSREACKRRISLANQFKKEVEKRESYNRFKFYLENDEHEKLAKTA